MNNFYNNPSLRRAEFFFFIAAILASLWPILSTPVFAMLDAPAHIYNARLIYEMIFKHNEVVKQFYVFNSLIVPNWTGHFLLVFLMIFFNAILTQKIFIIIYLIAFPFAFRYLIKTIKGNLAVSYFAFPLAYSFFFFLGFFNFLIGLPIMFWGMAQIIKNENTKGLKTPLLFLVFSLLVYFSHPILFAVWCIFAGIFYVYRLVQLLMEKGRIMTFAKEAAFTFVAMLPAFILAFLYLKHQPEDTFRIDLPAIELFRWLYKIRSLIFFSLLNEYLYTRLLSLLLTALFVSGAVYAFYHRKNGIFKITASRLRFLFWFDMAFVILILYFLIPDETNGGGYISSRLNLIFFIFLILGISQFRQYPLVKMVFVILVLTGFHWQLIYYNKIMKPLNKQAELLINLSDSIEEGKTLVYIDKTQNWLQGHNVNYLGYKKTIITHQNYEATKKYFPLVWNQKDRPELYFGDIKYENPCVSLTPVDYNKNKKEADYVLLFGNDSLNLECELLINKSLCFYYLKIFESEDGFVRLYLKKII